MVDSAHRSPGEQLRELRVLAGLSARELGRLAGVAPNTVTKIERGARPTPAVAAAVMSALVSCLRNVPDNVVAAEAEVARLRCEVEQNDARVKTELRAARQRLRTARNRHSTMVEALDGVETLWPTNEVAA